MYRPPAFAVDDVDTLHVFIREQPFATLAAMIDGAVQFAYAPVVIAPDGTNGVARFHLAAGNPLARLADGTAVRLSFLGANAYVSPDWYETPTRVPTWNYLAVEGQGAVRRLDRNELQTLLIDLSAAEETKLLPKKPWTIDKVPAERLAALLNAIAGFSVRLETLDGKFKLSQNTTAADIAGVVCGLDARGDAASRAVAEAMRDTKTA
ncbi:MAG TPA: FMN-binding negative transcriptional regulator [Rhizomicrobium sp.]